MWCLFQRALPLTFSYYLCFSNSLSPYQTGRLCSFCWIFSVIMITSRPTASVCCTRGQDCCDSGRPCLSPPPSSLRDYWVRLCLGLQYRMTQYQSAKSADSHCIVDLNLAIYLWAVMEKQRAACWGKTSPWLPFCFLSLDMSECLLFKPPEQKARLTS